MFALVYQLVNFGGPNGAFSTKTCLGSINFNCVTSIDKSKNELFFLFINNFLAPKTNPVLTESEKKFLGHGA
jgi:hypothetical protein